MKLRIHARVSDMSVQELRYLGDSQDPWASWLHVPWSMGDIVDMQLRSKINVFWGWWVGWVSSSYKMTL